MYTEYACVSIIIQGVKTISARVHLVGIGGIGLRQILPQMIGILN